MLVDEKQSTMSLGKSHAVIDWNGSGITKDRQQTAVPCSGDTSELHALGRRGHFCNPMAMRPPPPQEDALAFMGATWDRRPRHRRRAYRRESWDPHVPCPAGSVFTA